MTYRSSYADLIVFITVADGANMEHTPQQLAVATPNRRKLLPSPEVASGDLGLWSILRKNIGKCVLVVDISVVKLCGWFCVVGRDLSKVSMPVSLNEPLGALQVCAFVSLMYLSNFFVLFLYSVYTCVCFLSL